MLTILHNVLQLLLRVLLEGIAIEERVARLARPIVVKLSILAVQHAQLLQAARLYT